MLSMLWSSDLNAAHPTYRSAQITDQAISAKAFFNDAMVAVIASPGAMWRSASLNGSRARALYSRSP